MPYPPNKLSKESRKCENCGIDYFPYKFNKNQKYCSYKCIKGRSDGRWVKKEKIIKQCNYCNKILELFPSHINKNNFCSKNCSDKFLIGKKVKDETKNKISNTMKGRPAHNKGIKPNDDARRNMRIGQLKRVQNGKHNNYKGGISELRLKIRDMTESKIWRDSVFRRDKYTCRHCRTKKTNMESHHIKLFSTILDENKINTIEDAIKCKELWDVNNGITLCKKCHIFEHKRLKCQLLS